MSRCNVIVVGASAGGVEALVRLVRELPRDLDAAVAVALHTPENSPSALPSILARSGALPASHARDGEPLVHTRIYVAPPGHHLLIKRRTIRAVNGPHENGHRPAVDPMFRTAARAHGARVMGVVLSGSLDDGTAGLATIKATGGASLVQEPSDALFDGMPSSAIDYVDVDFVGPADAIGRELVRRTRRLVANQLEDTVAEEFEDELDIVEMDRGTTSRALEENAAVLRRLHEKAHARGHDRSAARFLSQAEGVEMRVGIIRQALNRGGAAPVA